MTRTRAALIIAGVAVAALTFHAQVPDPALTHRFTEIAPGVYSAMATGGLNLGSNSAVIVNQDDVIVVDSHISPEAGRALLRELKTLTSKPVTMLINTHFHYDHTNGNQSFPGIAIVGHEYTR